VLDSLVSDGSIGVSKKGKYGKPDNTAVVGIFESTRRGFGFVVVEGMEEDIFIPEEAVNGAFHMDKVKVTITGRKSGSKRSEGKIIGVLEHQIKELVGTFQKSKTYGFVVPDNGKIPVDIFVPQNMSKGALNGHKVVVKIKNYGTHGKNPEGEIVEIIGNINDPGTDILSIVKAYDLPVEFPESVLHFLEQIPDEVSEKDKAGRVDFRDVDTVTIDGEDAKDLDDAITLVKKDNIYQLGVHIADVSHYVTENSPLDKEAYKRGTSVYLVDRVIPMLPHKLSNGICSLNQGCDRLALSCIMEIDAKGNVVGHRICETVICVNRRMTYTNVKKILIDRDEEVIKEYEELVPMFEQMLELALILRKKRFKRGSIDFDFPETKIILDKDGHAVDVRPYDRNAATKIIEEFMLIANETVAEDYFWQEMPFVYRSHDNPDPEKIQKLASFINNFGYSIHVGDELHPKELQKLLEKVEGTDEENLIARLTLRSMKRAMYTTECVGHFGLAAKYYCHFTSPIRRYPDLQIHRIIKENLHGGIKSARIKHYNEILPEVAKHTSNTERRADDAERDTDKVKMVEYMKKHLGEHFEGVISSMTAWGMYVELPSTIEGMISVTSLRDGYYVYDENHYEMVNETTGRTFKLGQKVVVKAVAADKILRTIDFELVESEEE
jgi:ribonuclease R